MKQGKTRNQNKYSLWKLHHSIRHTDTRIRILFKTKYITHACKKNPSFWKKLDFHIGHPHIRIVIRCSRTSLVYLAKRLHRIVIPPYRSFGTEHLSLFLRRFVFHIYFIITILHIKVLLVRGTSVSVFGIFSNVTSGFVFWGFTLFLSSGRFLCETKCYL